MTLTNEQLDVQLAWDRAPLVAHLIHEFAEHHTFPPSRVSFFHKFAGRELH